MNLPHCFDFSSSSFITKRGIFFAWLAHRASHLQMDRSQVIAVVQVNGGAQVVLAQVSGASHPRITCLAAVTWPQLVPLAAGGRGRWRPDTRTSAIHAEGQEAVVVMTLIILLRYNVTNVFTMKGKKKKAKPVLTGMNISFVHQYIQI